jgi:hypothetical protein
MSEFKKISFNEIQERNKNGETVYCALSSVLIDKLSDNGYRQLNDICFIWSNRKCVEVYSDRTFDSNRIDAFNNGVEFFEYDPSLDSSPDYRKTYLKDDTSISLILSIN